MGYINTSMPITVDFDSKELIDKSIKHIDEKLFVAELQYTTKIGEQRDEIDKTDVATGTSFTSEKTRTQTLQHAETSRVKYDLVGKIAEETVLTRRTAAAILKGISPVKLIMFRYNPEEFISKVVKLINEQKATMIVEHISYDQIEAIQCYFHSRENTQSFDKAFKAEKHIQDY